jgi:hypothetical protein
MFKECTEERWDEMLDDINPDDIPLLVCTSAKEPVSYRGLPIGGGSTYINKLS